MTTQSWYTHKYTQKHLKKLYKNTPLPVPQLDQSASSIYLKFYYSQPTKTISKINSLVNRWCSKYPYGGFQLLTCCLIKYACTWQKQTLQQETLKKERKTNRNTQKIIIQNLDFSLPKILTGIIIFDLQPHLKEQHVVK